MGSPSAPTGAQPIAPPLALSSKARATFNVDLGPLKDAVRARARAEGLRPADVVRRAVQDCLAASTVGPAAGDVADLSSVYRPILSRRDAEKLDQLRAGTGLRTRQAVLRSLIAGFDLAAATAAGNEPQTGHLALATEQLIRSNAELVTVARSLDDVLRVVHQRATDPTGQTQALLKDAAAAVHAHLRTASRLAGMLAPLVRLSGEKQRPTQIRKAASAVRARA